QRQVGAVGGQVPPRDVLDLVDHLGAHTCPNRPRRLQFRHGSDCCTHSRALLLTRGAHRARVVLNREQCSRIKSEVLQMSQHVIAGAGPVGSATAVQLAERGESVLMITRSGTGPVHAGVQLIAADATDPNKLTALTQGASALYNCANPQY